MSQAALRRHARPLRQAVYLSRTRAVSSDSGVSWLCLSMQVAAMEAAIDAGYIRWNGKPMNIFPELTDGGLFARGMAMTEALNTRFNKVILVM